MTYRPQNSDHDQMMMNGMNAPQMTGRLSYMDSSSNNNSMFFPSGMTRMGMAGVEMHMMQTVMNARRLRAAQQINELRMLQANTNASVATKSTNRGPSTLKGLDLLGSVSNTLNHHSAPAAVSSEPSSHVIPVVSPPSGSLNKATVKLSVDEVAQCASKAESVDQSSSVEGETPTMFIDTIQEWDVLCGRGGRSNHHPGNKRYRHVVSEMKMMYRRSEAKAIKTDLSRAIVEHCCNYGGRFIKTDSKSGRYYILTKAEARKKTSQALRETKALKWTY
jgi:hypothetical protein